MKQVCNVWLPDQEEHLVPFLEAGKGTYQRLTLETALKHCRSFRTAVDVGAHVGLWSMHLAKRFEKVLAFEPIPQHRECFARNVPDANVTLFPNALGEEEKEVRLVWDSANTGHTHIGDGEIRCEMLILDGLSLTEVDFLKVDTEGYEYYVLRGGRKLLQRCRPIVCIEQKPHGFYGLEVTQGLAYLEGLGAHVFDRVRKDYVLGWPPTWTQRLQARIKGLIRG